jgi:GDP-D-mannose dehydratase
MSSTSPRRALITGITGQDGSYLAELLLEKGYRVVGVTRRTSSHRNERIAHLEDRLELVSADLLDQSSLASALAEVRPHEVYNLAAQSFVPTSWNAAAAHGRVHRARGDAAARRPSGRWTRTIRFYQASAPARCSGTYADAAERGDAVLSAQPVWRGEVLRALDHGQLPGVLRPVRRQRDPVQPREPAARARVRDAEGDSDGVGAHQARPGEELRLGNLDAGATGATPATTSTRCG